MIRWLQSFPYFLREAFKDLRENAGGAAIALGTTTISLILLGALWIVQLNVAGLVDAWRERFQLTIFLGGQSTPEQRGALRKTVLAAPGVERIEEVNPEEAFREMQGWLGQDADLLRGLDRSFLPPSYRVIFRPGRRDLAHVERLMAQVRTMPGVERTRNDILWLRRLEGLIRIVTVAVWTLTFLLGLGVVFIIGNTIRLTLFARREDIAIMHLVGATDLFIKTPYVTEGALCGAAGGLLAFGVLWGVFHGLFQPIAGGATGADFAVHAGGWRLALGLVGSGMALGLIGSFVSVRHFLRGSR
ncbi:MAG: ABC transporter permease [Candidatus Tectomicrobia bacterium]|uniref:Cell division protein FtsX n=1 Tax=Tectimicrobiota bacterium TaxID=2528274 RepID=A0A932I178_UNCTE|nr:ABC transporter permease [Candidatus Tectomicrobia bacterium]